MNDRAEVSVLWTHGESKQMKHVVKQEDPQESNKIIETSTLSRKRAVTLAYLRENGRHRTAICILLGISLICQKLRIRK